MNKVITDLYTGQGWVAKNRILSSQFKHKGAHYRPLNSSDQWFSKRGPRKAATASPTPHLWNQKRGMGPALCLKKPFRDSDAHQVSNNSHTRSLGGSRCGSSSGTTACCFYSCWCQNQMASPIPRQEAIHWIKKPLPQLTVPQTSHLRNNWKVTWLWGEAASLAPSVEPDTVAICSNRMHASYLTCFSPH